MRCWSTALVVAGLCCLTPSVLAGERVKGSLIHKNSGEPVIGAPVRLDETRTAVSDEKGRFVFEGVAEGPHLLRIDDPECAPFEARFEVQPGKALELNYGLDPRGEDDTRTVVVKAKRLEEEISDTVLQIEEVKRIPGTQGDVLKIVQSLPGVARSSMVRGAAAAGVVVRGSAPEDSTVLIDGHPVPLMYHFGGIKSVINSDMLKRIDFLPGGFGAEYGEATGGVIDTRTRTCDHPGYDGYVDASLLDAGVFFQGPISSDAGFMAAARQSTVQYWLPEVLPAIPGFEMTVAPRYYDYQAKVEWAPGPHQRLSAFGFGSSDRLEFLLQKPPSGDPTLRGEFSSEIAFHRAQLSWSFAPRPDWQLTASLVGGIDRFDLVVGESRYLRAGVDSVRTRADLEWDVSPRYKLSCGLYGGGVHYGVRHSIPRPPKEGEVGRGQENWELIQGEEYLDIYGLMGYATLGIRLAEESLLTIGVRAEGYTDPLEQVAVMPRLSFKHVLRPGTVFKAGVGLYTKPATEDELSRNFGNPDLLLERAWHYTAGLEQEMPWHLRFEFTTFFKTMDRLVVPNDETVYSNDGTGEVAGIEVLLRRDMMDNFFGWLAYTLMHSRRKDGPGEPWRLFDFDQTHILTLVAGYRLPTGPVMPNHGLQDGWEFGLRFQLVSGNPNTPFWGGIYDADYDTYYPIPGAINSERLPAFHQLDVRVDYTWAFESWALSLYLDIQNIYNHQSAEGVRYNYDYTDRAYLEGLPILPALGVKGSF